MKNYNIIKIKELELIELCNINGGGPLVDAIDWYYKTIGSFCRGLYDGLVGNEPVV